MGLRSVSHLVRGELKYIYLLNFKGNRKNPELFEVAAVKSIKFEASYNVSDLIKRLREKFKNHVT